MKKRFCTGCNTEYSDYGQRASLCRPCRKIYNREYHKNRCPKKKAENIENSLRRKKLVAQAVINYLKVHPCITCGEDRIPALQFDHREPEDKFDSVSDMVKRGFSKEKVFKEIEKCDVLCANCHSVKTSIQFNWYKGLDVGD